MSGLLKPLPVFPSQFSGEISDRMAFDVHTHSFLVVGVPVLEDEHRNSMFLDAILGSTAADCLERNLVMGFADNFNTERAGPVNCTYGSAPATRSALVLRCPNAWGLSRSRVANAEYRAVYHAPSGTSRASP
jgi:hypothetical protein